MASSAPDHLRTPGLISNRPCYEGITILPTVMATNPAAFHTRRYLAHRFHIDTIVSSHDPDRIFFSENTSIGEILLICRRWNNVGSMA